MIAARLTFYGQCKEAVEFYSRVFDGKVISQSYFEENMEQFPLGLSDENKKMIYSVLLQVTDERGDSYISMSDSPVLAFSGMQGNLGCRDNVIFDVKLYSDSEVERIYHEFVKDGAKCNIALCTKNNYSKYASFIDKFGVCWNVYCEK